MGKKPTTAELFWSCCDQSGGPESCWPWIKYKNRGYGQFRFRGATKYAHRHAYELTNGPIVKGESSHDTVVMHACDNPACVNPSHLRLGSQRENSIDRDQKGRSRHARGEENGFSKLKLQEVIAIKEELGRGVSPAALARQYGCTRATISHIKWRRNWAHVEYSP